MKRRHLFAALLACAAVFTAAHGETQARTVPALFIAGDSTAAKYDAPDQQGWAEPFARYFDPAQLQINNRARGGRSSRTFITEGHWDQMLAEVQPGDFVMIQFGHNDAGALNEEPPGSTRPLRARGTIPGTGDQSAEIDNVITGKHEVVHTFGWYLRRMIADVRAHGATPILVTLTVTNNWNEERIACNTDYRRWDREVADAEKVKLIDLTRIVTDRYQQLGPAAVAKFFDKDAVHPNPAGADANARAVIAALRATPDLPLAAALSAAGLQVPADTGASPQSVCPPLR
ncbi:MAG TPA: rhamnogalacturonan acetylesterase [Povalibacter sp.]|nr:rhamnogalacturonan acetylesterase [Povalibacter sp.]